MMWIHRQAAARSHIDGDLATHGFVLHATDMGQQCLQLTLDDVVSRVEAKIELMDLGDSERLPDFEGTDGNTDTARLDERPEQLKRN
jgi:hypothetical protein